MSVQLLLILLVGGGWTIGCWFYLRRADPPDLITGPEWIPPAACWTEEIVSDSRYTYSRSCCVDDQLMQMDAVATRGESIGPGGG